MTSSTIGGGEARSATASPTGAKTPASPSLVFDDTRGMEADLAVSHVSNSWPGFALDDVSLVVPRGYVVGLVGQNGAGKTTLMKAILGLVRHTGTIELFGRDVSTLSDAEVATLRQRIAFVSAVCAYPQEMSVADVGRLLSMAYPTFSSDGFEHLLDSFGMLGESNAGKKARRPLDPHDRKVKDLSRGMGMKLQVAGALASGATLLVLDEPTAGLDPVVREDVLDALRSWMAAGEHSMLISSHITGDLEAIADYLVMMDDGRVVMASELARITDQMGIARLRSSELEVVLAEEDGLVDRAHVLARDMGYELLVLDREAFASANPDVVCDRPTIEGIMQLLVRGEQR